MDIIVHPFGRIHDYSTERVNYFSNRIAFGQLLLEECKTLRSRASINPYAEDKEDYWFVYDTPIALQIQLFFNCNISTSPLVRTLQSACTDTTRHLYPHYKPLVVRLQDSL